MCHCLLCCCCRSAVRREAICWCHSRRPVSELSRNHCGCTSTNHVVCCRGETTFFLYFRFLRLCLWRAEERAVTAVVTVPLRIGGFGRYGARKHKVFSVVRQPTPEERFDWPNVSSRPLIDQSSRRGQVMAAHATSLPFAFLFLPRASPTRGQTKRHSGSGARFTTRC